MVSSRRSVVVAPPSSPSGAGCPRASATSLVFSLGHHPLECSFGVWRQGIAKRSTRAPGAHLCQVALARAVVALGGPVRTLVEWVRRIPAVEARVQVGATITSERLGTSTSTSTSTTTAPTNSECTKGRLAGCLELRLHLREHVVVVGNEGTMVAVADHLANRVVRRWQRILKEGYK